jgi:hypothetical protein
MGKKSISHKISDEDALKLIYEFNSKLFYAGEKTIWYNNKAKLYDVSVTAIASIVCRLTRKYLIVVEDEETWADS